MRDDLDKLAQSLQDKVDADAVKRFGEIVVERFKNPRHLGLLDLASAVGRAASGDREVTVSLRMEKGRVADAGVAVKGCGTQGVCADVAAGLAVGRGLDEALEIDARAVVAALDGLPKDKIKYARLAAEALHAALGEAKAKGMGES